MSTLIFVMTASSGSLITAFALVFLTKRKRLTLNQKALLVSIGLFLTWIASYFLPLLAQNSPRLSTTTIVFGLVVAVIFASAAFVAARFFLAAKHGE